MIRTWGFRRDLRYLGLSQFYHRTISQQLEYFFLSQKLVHNWIWSTMHFSILFYWKKAICSSTSTCLYFAYSSWVNWIVRWLFSTYIVSNQIQKDTCSGNPFDRGVIRILFSGNTEVTRLVLEAGAKVTDVNSVGRTAAQMAAFIGKTSSFIEEITSKIRKQFKSSPCLHHYMIFSGQHQCVSVINNFFPKENLQYFTKPQGMSLLPL